MPIVGVVDPTEEAEASAEGVKVRGGQKFLVLCIKDLFNLFNFTVDELPT